ncbi:MAG: hypothetical protein E6J56_13610 [Deltaproteobacteria bacterium]|nr:MAG: hypothetical protein E6J56_13610 [Deltaproteobacteria bacterium]
MALGDGRRRGGRDPHGGHRGRRVLLVALRPSARRSRSYRAGARRTAGRARTPASATGECPWRPEAPHARARRETPPAATPRRTEPAVRAGNEPRIQVGAIRYSQAPPERTVTLAIDGGTPLTLHQGESTGDLEVQLILPDGVYVRRGGHVWMVSADR